MPAVIPLYPNFSNISSAVLEYSAAEPIATKATIAAIAAIGAPPQLAHAPTATCRAPEMPESPVANVAYSAPSIATSSKVSSSSRRGSKVSDPPGARKRSGSSTPVPKHASNLGRIM